jgi:hypothetical protein
MALLDWLFSTNKVKMWRSIPGLLRTAGFAVAWCSIAGGMGETHARPSSISIAAEICSVIIVASIFGSCLLCEQQESVLLYLRVRR